MATVTLRLVKGSPLTNQEVDDNFNNLNTDKFEVSGGTLTGKMTTVQSSASTASILLNPGSADPSSPVAGDFWNNGGDLKFYDGSSTIVLTDAITSAVTQVSTGTGLTGGPITSTGTISLSHLGLESLTDPNADRIAFWDDSAGAFEWLTVGSGLTITGTTLESTGSGGTVTSVEVAAGNGLTGGGTVTTSGTITVNVGAGTGIDVTADAIAVDVSDFMSNGANNRIVTATGTDAMNAEANLTFDGSTLAVTGDATVSGDLQTDTYSLGISALGSVTTTQAIDLATSNYFSATSTGNTTWTFTNVPTSRAVGFVLELTNGGAYTQTWPTSVDWPGGSAPSLVASGVDVLTFITDDSGTTWRGVLSMSDSK